MDIVTSIFQVVSAAINNFITALSSAISSVTAIFYADGSFTFVGVMLLIAVGVGIVYWAFRFIRGLVARA